MLAMWHSRGIFAGRRDDIYPGRAFHLLLVASSRLGCDLEAVEFYYLVDFSRRARLPSGLRVINGVVIIVGFGAQLTMTK